MKSLARSYIWWPKMDYNIEDLTKSCTMCQQTSAHLTKGSIMSLVVASTINHGIT